MDLNADFSQQVLVHADEVDWRASPMPGVDRRMLDRIGDEVARATTIVRYAPKSQFSSHTHTGGEEFIVLEGVFQDEHGDYPVGTYVRNPPTTAHTPGAAEGCVIFVKLWQFDMDDRTQMRADMAAGLAEVAPGLSQNLLHEDRRETVTFESWAPGLAVNRDLPGGAEILVIDGTLTAGDATLRQHSWLRLPQNSRLTAVAGAQGARVWIKSGHLPFARAPQI